MQKQLFLRTGARTFKTLDFIEARDWIFKDVFPYGKKARGDVEAIFPSKISPKDFDAAARVHRIDTGSVGL
jgi:hypothetical protein